MQRFQVAFGAGERIQKRKLKLKKRSVAYQNAVETFGTEGSDAKVKAFIEENKDSGYASIANLLAAKQAVDAGDLDAAASHLNSVVTFAEIKLKVLASLFVACSN